MHRTIAFLPVVLLFAIGTVGTVGAACGDDDVRPSPSQSAAASGASSPTSTPTVMARTPTPTAPAGDIGAVRAAGLNLVSADPGASRGAPATIAVRTAPGVTCRLTATTATRVGVPLPDGGRTTSGADGVAKWTFVPDVPGRGSWEVVCGDLTITGAIGFP